MISSIRLEEDTSTGLALLPSPKNKLYLYPKATQAAQFPQIRTAVSKTGKHYEVHARQVVMSGLIRVEEGLHDFLWYYKAEVNFEMPIDESLVPRPFLSMTAPLGKDGQKDPNRRHSLTPFPVGRKKGFLRRPDLIIVRDKAIRWPARAVTDHEGVFHADNLLRLVEMKFPGDSMGKKQEEAYTHIAGGPNRFTLLNVIYEKERQQPVKIPVPLPASQPENKDNIAKQRALIYGPRPLPNPALYEPWLANIHASHFHSILAKAEKTLYEVRMVGEEAINRLRRGLTILSKEMYGLLQQHAPWLFSTGSWIRNEYQKTWQYVAENGSYLFQLADAELKAAWQSIQQETDLLLDDLRMVEWSQILLDVGEGRVTAVLIVAGVVVLVVLGGELLALLMALIEIAPTAWAALSALLASVSAELVAATAAAKAAAAAALGGLGATGLATN